MRQKRTLLIQLFCETVHLTPLHPKLKKWIMKGLKNGSIRKEGLLYVYVCMRVVIFHYCIIIEVEEAIP